MSDLIVKNNDAIALDNQIQVMDDRIKAMKGFVQNQLVKGIGNDYAKIPGTPKNTLLKPGAEKLLILFKLGFRFDIIDKEIDLIEGTVSFMVKCSIFHKDTGSDMGEYIGYCTNREKKYKTQNAADIINTILKMAEKRALVGATISTTGASDYFTQDVEDVEKKKDINSSKFTSKEKSNFHSYEVPVGKHKGKTFSEIGKDDLSKYCTWISDNNSDINGKMKELLDNAREFLRSA